MADESKLMATDHQNPDNLAESLDELLADYLRWLDSGGEAEASSFLLQLAQPPGDPVADAFHCYLRDADEVMQLAADTTCLWLEDDTSDLGRQDPFLASEQMPVSFGDYELLEEIARGGMGVVYKARQKRLNRTVCVKRILFGEFATERDIDRFLTEAEAAAKLHHPNIVTIYEVGVVHEEYYFSMEFVSGPSLADRVADGPASGRQAAEYLRTIARAVHYAHENNVIHRDLKPSNVVLDELDQPRVTDFGLAKLVGGDSLTASGAMVGSPSYMAPEQTRGDRQASEVTSDIYGLGAILYEVLTARPPFRGNTPLDTLWRVREQEPVRPSQFESKVPRDLETICLKCLEKLPQRRYATALAVAEELDRFLDGAPIHARPAGPVRKTARWLRRNPVAAVVGFTLVTLAAVASWSYVTTASLLLEVQESHGQQQRLVRQLEVAGNNAEDHLYLATIHMARRALEDGELDRLDTLLERVRPVANDQDRRGWEWFYLKAVGHEDEVAISGHNGPAYDVTWAPRGKRLASVGADRVLRIWDCDTGELLRAVDGSDAVSVSVDWSATSERVATADDDGAVRIWDPRTGRLAFQLGDNSTSLRSVAWDPNGLRLAAASDDGTISLWYAEAGQPLMRFDAHDQRVNSVAWSADGTRLASAGDDGALHVFSAEDGHVLFTVAAHRDWTNDVAWSPDGLHLASVSQDGELKVWRIQVDASAGSVQAEEVFVRLTANRTKLSTVAFSPDGQRVVTGGSDPWLTVRSVESGDVVGRLRGHRTSVRSVSWESNSGRIASTGEDGSIHIWDLSIQPEGVLLAHSRAPVRTVAWSPKGQWLAYRDLNDVIGLCTVASEGPLNPSRFAELPETAQAFAWHPNGTSMALATGEIVTLLDIVDRGPRLYLERRQGAIWAMCFSSSGELLATGSRDGTVLIWNVDKGEPVHNLQEHETDVRALTWSKDGRWLASADAQGTVIVHSVERGWQQASFSVETSAINSLRFSPTGRWLCTSTHEGTVEIWEVETGVRIRSLSAHHGPSWSALWSPDGARLATSGQDGKVRIWNATTGEEVLQLDGHDGSVWSIDWSPDGRRLISAGADKTIRVWDASHGYDPRHKGRTP